MDMIVSHQAPGIILMCTTLSTSLRVPESQIYNYSFSLRPEEHQPSGTCNFSRIDNAQLQYSLQPMILPADAEKGLSPNNESYAPTLNLMMFATNYNVLRVMSGMGGLAYSN